MFRLWNSSEFPVAAPPVQDFSYPIDLEKDEQPCSRRAYALTDSTVEVDFRSAEIESILQAVLGHLEIPQCETCNRHFEVRIDGDRYSLTKDGVEVAREQSPHRLRHALVYEIARTSYPDAEWLVFLHAGSVSDGKRAIVMPGTPCCGKSTLTAALTLEGFRYCCEDIAPVSRRSWQIFPVATRICLREGGWDALSRQYPGLRPTEGGRRWGKQLRYLSPPSGLKPGPAPIRCIVFPEYAADLQFELSPISGEEKLTRLIQTGAWFGDSLNREWIEELLQWVEATPGYRLRYPNTRKAIAAIGELLSHE